MRTLPSFAELLIIILAIFCICSLWLRATSPFFFTARSFILFFCSFNIGQNWAHSRKATQTGFTKKKVDVLKNKAQPCFVSSIPDNVPLSGKPFYSILDIDLQAKDTNIYGSWKTKNLQELPTLRIGILNFLHSRAYPSLFWYLKFWIFRLVGLDFSFEQKVLVQEKSFIFKS